MHPGALGAVDVVVGAVANEDAGGRIGLADEVGVEKYALENFSAMLVWNPDTLFRLRNEVGPKVGMNLDPSGTFLYVANQNSDTIVVFRVDPSTGKLAPTGETVHTPTPVDIEFGGTWRSGQTTSRVSSP